jgi:hypothetical protein
MSFAAPAALTMGSALPASAITLPAPTSSHNPGQPSASSGSASASESASVIPPGEGSVQPANVQVVDGGGLPKPPVALRSDLDADEARLSQPPQRDDVRAAVESGTNGVSDGTAAAVDSSLDLKTVTGPSSTDTLPATRERRANSRYATTASPPMSASAAASAVESTAASGDAPSKINGGYRPRTNPAETLSRKRLKSNGSLVSVRCNGAQVVQSTPFTLPGAGNAVALASGSAADMPAPATSMPSVAVQAMDGQWLSTGSLLAFMDGGEASRFDDTAKTYTWAPISGSVSAAVPSGTAKLKPAGSGGGKKRPLGLLSDTLEGEESMYGTSIGTVLSDVRRSIDAEGVDDDRPDATECDPASSLLNLHNHRNFDSFGTETGDVMARLGTHHLSVAVEQDDYTSEPLTVAFVLRVIQDMRGTSDKGDATRVRASSLHWLLHVSWRAVDRCDFLVHYLSLHGHSLVVSTPLVSCSIAGCQFIRESQAMTAKGQTSISKKFLASLEELAADGRTILQSMVTPWVLVVCKSVQVVIGVHHAVTLSQDRRQRLIDHIEEVFNPDPLQVLANVAHDKDAGGASTAESRVGPIRHHPTIIKWRNGTLKLLACRSGVVAGVEALRTCYLAKCRLKESAKLSATRDGSKEETEFCCMASQMFLKGYSMEDLNHMLTTAVPKVTFGRSSPLAASGLSTPDTACARAQPIPSFLQQKVMTTAGMQLVDSLKQASNEASAWMTAASDAIQSVTFLSALANLVHEAGRLRVCPIPWSPYLSFCTATRLYRVGQLV